MALTALAAFPCFAGRGIATPPAVGCTVAILPSVLTPASGLQDSAPDRAPSAGVDLEKLYPATREWSSRGLFPVATGKDVWRLSSYSLALGKDLSINAGPSTVVLGHDRSDVLWAVVLPDAPPPVVGALAPEGEHAGTITLRFAPSQVGQFFPAKTIVGRGDPMKRYEAARIARRKMVWKWCTPGGNPTIVPRGIVIADVDTVEGPRRFWAADRGRGTTLRVDDFVDQATPSPAPIDHASAEACFDAAWSAFDREYPGFVDLPGVDWSALRDQWRPKASAATDVYTLAAILAELIAPLEDLHAWVRCGDDVLQGYTRERPINGDWIATRTRIIDAHESGSNLVWGRLEGDLGYIGVMGLTDPALPELVDEALEALRDAKGLVVDLRFNGGGDELLARAIAGRFAADPVVYSRNRYRNGPAHDDLGPELDRVLQPRGPWRFAKPVVCLIGRGTMSSAESLAAMFAECPNVTTMGAPTCGSSGNPRRVELDCGIVVNLPRWRDLRPDGTPLERRGLAPDVALDHPASAFSPEFDPVLGAAIAQLR